MKKGNRYGTHRVIEPKGVLPQPALRVDNNMEEIYDNEILVDVITLNIDSASFTRIKKEAGNDIENVKKIMLDIVAKHGKHKNPWTGSGGMFIGKVNKIGDALKDKINLKPGDKIASLVSLSLTPLRIDKIKNASLDSDQVDIEGQAILFESGIYAKLPDDMPEKLALAVLDVAGAPPQVARLAKMGDTVVITGANGKSGLLCCYEAKKRVGCTGKVVAHMRSDRDMDLMKRSGFCDEIIIADATDALKCLEELEKVNNGKPADVVINCVNNEDTEMGSILMCRDDGVVYFFSMATSFTKAALGAEGIGKDVNMIIGNGYCKDHADFTINLLRESKFIYEEFSKRYM